MEKPFTLYFQFGEVLIQVTPSVNLCFIFSGGRPIWSGDKEQLIDILKSI